MDKSYLINAIMVFGATKYELECNQEQKKKYWSLIINQQEPEWSDPVWDKTERNRKIIICRKPTIVREE